VRAVVLVVVLVVSKVGQWVENLAVEMALLKVVSLVGHSDDLSAAWLGDVWVDCSALWMAG